MYAGGRRYVKWNIKVRAERHCENAPSCSETCRVEKNSPEFSLWLLNMK